MRSVLACALVWGAAAAARAELKPTEVGIVGLAASADSRRLAEHYAQARGVPPAQILLLEGKPTDELSRDEWDTRVRPAIRAWLAQGKREEQIRCLVTTLDVPLKIGRRNENLPVVAARKEYLAWARENRVQQVNAMVKLVDGMAAAEGLVSGRAVLKADASLAEVTQVFDAALKAARMRIEALPEGEQKGALRVGLERAFVAGGGSSVLLRGLAEHPERVHLGAEEQKRVEFLKGELQGLQEGLRALGSLADSVARDGQLLALLQRAGGLLAALQWIDSERDALKGNETYASFDSELSLIYWDDYPLYRWQPNLLHYAYGTLTGAHRATMMVSRLAAPTLAAAMNLVDVAMRVEKVGLTGKVYLDARGIAYNPKTAPHGSYGEYDQSLRDLADRLQRHTSLSVVLDNRAELFPPGSCPDAALYCGWYSLSNYVDAFQWRPGAVGYHLASLEAQTLTTPGSKVWCNAMLERGVCATLGPVYEPYLHTFPLPDDFFSLLLCGRYSLVETYYRTSAYTSWVMVLVGDPLYNPFAKDPPLKESDLPERLKPKAPGAIAAGEKKPADPPREK